nr:GHKL domain-containing protein [Bacteroidales bacterium]
EMLRYVFYDCSKDKVHLSAEIKYMENFTAFQQMKSENKQNISITNDSGMASLGIAPMLFIPFIENAFKYSRIEEDEKAYVTIAINKKNHHLIFAIQNSVPHDNKPMSGSGTGIKNVEHRLAIIYANKHQLDIQEKENTYTVNLSIKI